MNNFPASIVKIREVLPHDNAERLEIAMIEGWACVTGKGQFRAGDKAIYIAVDSVLTPDVQTAILGDSKITLHKSRVRAIRIRGKVSQGLLVGFKEWPKLAGLPVEEDVSLQLGVTKYEPPVPEYQKSVPGAPRKKANPLFKEYTDISNIKHYFGIFKDGETVVMTEKIHGTSARYALLPTVANTLWKRFKKLVGLLPKYEFCYGSRRVQLQNQPGKKGYYGEDVYGNIAKQHDIEKLLLPGEEVFGEIYGPGIQKGYAYSAEEHCFVVYDVQKDGRWLDHGELVMWCEGNKLPMVPVLYVGPYSDAKLAEFTSGPSILDPHTKVREGTVVRSINETIGPCGRVVLKSISPEYSLNKDNSDFH